MTPIEFEGMNTVLRAPEGAEDWCQDLKIHRGAYEGGMPFVLSCWRASWRERLAILFTGRVWFRAISNTHPPISIQGTRPEELRP